MREPRLNGHREVKRFTLELPDDLYEQLVLRAAAEGVPLALVIRAALRRHLRWVTR